MMPMAGTAAAPVAGYSMFAANMPTAHHQQQQQSRAQQQQVAYSALQQQYGDQSSQAASYAVTAYQLQQQQQQQQHMLAAYMAQQQQQQQQQHHHQTQQQRPSAVSNRSQAQAVGTLANAATAYNYAAAMSAAAVAGNYVPSAEDIYPATLPSPPTSPQPQFSWQVTMVDEHNPTETHTYHDMGGSSMHRELSASSLGPASSAAAAASTALAATKARRTQIPAETMANLIRGPDPVDNKYVCLYGGCMRRFGRKYNIQSHIQTHLSDRPFRCGVCSAGFVRRHDLVRHARIHADGKEFMCACGKGFSRTDALNRHKQRQICEGGRIEAAAMAVARANAAVASKVVQQHQQTERATQKTAATKKSSKGGRVDKGEAMSRDASAQSTGTDDSSHSSSAASAASVLDAYTRQRQQHTAQMHMAAHVTAALAYGVPPPDDLDDVHGQASGGVVGGLPSEARAMDPRSLQMQRGPSSSSASSRRAAAAAAAAVSLSRAASPADFYTAPSSQTLHHSGNYHHTQHIPPSLISPTDTLHPAEFDIDAQMRAMAEVPAVHVSLTRPPSSSDATRGAGRKGRGGKAVGGQRTAVSMSPSLAYVSPPLAATEAGPACTDDPATGWMTDLHTAAASMGMLRTTTATTAISNDHEDDDGPNGPLMANSFAEALAEYHGAGTTHDDENDSDEDDDHVGISPPFVTATGTVSTLRSRDRVVGDDEVVVGGDDGELSEEERHRVAVMRALSESPRRATSRMGGLLGVGVVAAGGKRAGGIAKGAGGKGRRGYAAAGVAARV
ncbi:Metallothionein expression activator [Savitreella phatthalungensis]